MKREQLKQRTAHVRGTSLRGRTIGCQCMPQALWHFERVAAQARALTGAARLRFEALIRATGGEQVMAIRLARPIVRENNVLGSRLRPGVAARAAITAQRRNAPVQGPVRVLLGLAATMPSTCRNTHFRKARAGQRGDQADRAGNAGHLAAQAGCETRFGDNPPLRPGRGTPSDSHRSDWQHYLPACREMAKAFCKSRLAR